MSKEKLKALREPFKENQISKLPKPYKKDSPRGNCKECGGYHGLPALHLDYVGHAALTDRLLDVDPEWTWEPLSFDEKGLPSIDDIGGLWIRLTVCGITRLGYGHAYDKKGGDAVKELIGDALRNAAMRFGAALDLWHKGELHIDDTDKKPEKKTVVKDNVTKLETKPELEKYKGKVIKVTKSDRDGYNEFKIYTEDDKVLITNQQDEALAAKKAKELGCKIQVAHKNCMIESLEALIDKKVSKVEQVVDTVEGKII